MFHNTQLIYILVVLNYFFVSETQGNQASNDAPKQPRTPQSLGCLNYGHSCLGAHGKRNGKPGSIFSLPPLNYPINALNGEDEYRDYLDAEALLPGTYQLKPYFREYMNKLAPSTNVNSPFQRLLRYYGNGLNAYRGNGLNGYFFKRSLAFDTEDAAAEGRLRSEVGGASRKANDAVHGSEIKKAMEYFDDD